MTTDDQNGPAERAEETGAAAAVGRLSVTTASGTDVGRVRSVNQDAFGEFEDRERGLRLLVIADGMGGHRGGEVASRLAIDRIGELFRDSAEGPEAILRKTLEGANTKIFDAAALDSELTGMGTTGVAILFDSSETVCVAHVGDSRAYRLRGEEFDQVTSDHSLVGELVRRGQLTAEEARVHPQSNEILRALGTQSDVEIEISSLDAQAGDRFLLCSDGLSGMLPDAEIARVLGELRPDEAVPRLIELANEAGGTDNITIQIAEITGANADARSEPDPDAVETSEPDPSPRVESAASQPSAEVGAAGSRLRWTMLVVLVGAVVWLVYKGLDGSG